MQLIDTHCHLDEDAFASDVEEVVQRARDAGVSKLLTIGTTLATSQAAVALANQFPDVYAVVGIQPNYVSAAQPGDWEAIVELSRAPKVVGIGETGLDCFWDYAPLDLQRDYFARHLQLARERQLPFVIHCRSKDGQTDAEVAIVEQLREFAQGQPLRGLMHSFAGTRETAAACLELGLYLSFSAMVTFKRNQALRDVVLEVPMDRLLVETDAPYLAPAPHRGKRNEPAFVKITAGHLADLRGVSREEFAATTTANALRLFALT